MVVHPEFSETMNVKKVVLIMSPLILILVVTFMQISNNDSSPVQYDSHGRPLLPTAAALKRLPEDGGEHFNRLVFEKSPYLLQHAGNPVDWYPWGDAAFEKARQEDKPIFLSIGYSTCHWCHVMEHESFEDSTVAALLNDAFICIKVDREERPDIDQLYMSVCQAMTGSGGWPLTILMTPDKRPFFAGTYLPKETSGPRWGLLDFVPRVKSAWAGERTKLLDSAARVVDFLKQNSQPTAGGTLDDKVLKTAFQQLASSFDADFGGFGQSPKFPTPHNFTFLLRYWQRTGDSQALEMVEKSLQQMRLGGVFDHVGFGFHRYSTDRLWLLPHFEKMLYDQATLAMAYTETFQATGKEIYALVAREIFQYVLRDMTSPEGGFYSAEDADSEGEEGLFYVWKPEEIKEILGDEEGAFFIEMFNVKAGGNFADQATGHKTGDSILHLQGSFAELAAEKNIPEDVLTTKWESARKKLFSVREKRIHPLKDDKVLTDWNGLMIAALAKAAVAFNEPSYTKAAKNAADFVLSRLRNNDGTLLKRYRDGEAALPAHAEDYAFTIWGLIELYQASFEVRYLREALALNNVFIKHFWDEENGGFFFTADTNNEELLVRNKEIYDGAIPSANSVAALNLVRLARMTANEDFEKKSGQIFRAFAMQVNRAASGHTQLMSAVDFATGPSFEVVIAGDPGREDTKNMLRALHEKFIPNKVVVFRPANEAEPEIVQLAAYTEHQRAINGQATAYVCRNFACKAPTTRVEEMLDALSTSKVALKGKD